MSDKNNAVSMNNPAPIASNPGVLIGHMKKPAIEGSWGGKKYTGSLMNIKNSDPASKKPQLKKKAHVRLFNMMDPTDLKDYRIVLQQCCDGKARANVKEILRDNGLHIYLEWYDEYYTDPGAS